jgi:hypothetical protein
MGMEMIPVSGQSRANPIHIAPNTLQMDLLSGAPHLWDSSNFHGGRLFCKQACHSGVQLAKVM